MSKYTDQPPPRVPRTPPHVPLRALREAMGLTLDQVIGRINQEFPELTPSRGSISAIESGARGASAQMLRALAVSYGLTPGSITTDYEPRAREAAAS